MPLDDIETTLRGMIEADGVRSKPAPKPSVWRRAFGRKAASAKTARPPGRKPAPPAARSATGGFTKKTKKKTWRERRSDAIGAALGAGLAVGCASFPWYIFFNPEKFGVQEMRFSGRIQPQDAPMGMDSRVRVGAPMTVEDIPAMKLDLFATATVNSEANEEKGAEAKVIDQPFPGDAVDFRMIYASAGRAMIADDTGLWVVERGSLLPDNSRVSSIEQRDGRWVLVTSRDGVIRLSAN
jgi:hypothetical protein